MKKCHKPEQICPGTSPGYRRNVKVAANRSFRRQDKQLLDDAPMGHVMIAVAATVHGPVFGMWLHGTSSLMADPTIKRYGRRLCLTPSRLERA
jgi:hypothetical protein